MPRTINLQNIKIHEITFADYTISVVYSILDDTGKEFDRKRTTISDLTNLQKEKLDKVQSLILLKLKTKEQL